MRLINSCWWPWPLGWGKNLSSEPIKGIEQFLLITLWDFNAKEKNKNKNEILLSSLAERVRQAPKGLGLYALTFFWCLSGWGGGGEDKALLTETRQDVPLLCYPLEWKMTWPWLMSHCFAKGWPGVGGRVLQRLSHIQGSGLHLWHCLPWQKLECFVKWWGGFGRAGARKRAERIWGWENNHQEYYLGSCAYNGFWRKDDFQEQLLVSRLICENVFCD